MRTKEQIELDMAGVEAKFPQLQAIAGNSTVSFYSLLKAMWVLLVMAVEFAVDQAISQAVKAQAENQTGSLAWYVKTIKAFQYGDSVTVYDNLTVGYSAVNLDKQIIKQAAVSEQPDGRLLVKIAKANGDILIPLDEAELLAAKEYVRQVKYAGVPVDVVSLAADELRLNVTVKYNRQVLNASGQLLISPFAPRPVDEAVKAYLKSLPFDSVLNWNALTDALQKVPGVVDFQITQSWSRPAGSSAWNAFSRETTSRAGHMSLSLDSVFSYV